MEVRSFRTSWASFALTWLLTTIFILPSQALYFHVEGGKAKCFYEDLPKDTLVVGKTTSKPESETQEQC